jgi:hypothetical protein
MKIDYSSWSTRLLSIDNLKLDVKNPRFSYQSTKEMNQTEIVKYLIENHAVYELAKAIAINGYLLNEEPIVCKEGDSYVVLEGNRRVAACKILLNPYKFLSPQRAKELSKYDPIDDKIRCNIAPTRRDADTLIYNKHTGIPLQKWDKVSQDAFLANLLQSENLSAEQVAYKLSVPASEIRKALRRHAIHQYSIKLFQSEPYELEQILEQGFPITNFERFYDDERGLNFLGLTFGSNGEIQKRLPDEEFNRRFKFIVNQILSQDLTSRTFNNEEDKKEYFSTIQNYDKDRFDLDIEPSQTPLTTQNENVSESTSSETKESGDGETSARTKRTRKKSGLFADYNWGDTGVSKLDALFESLKELAYKRHMDMAGIALRCYVDMLVYEFLRAKKCIGEINKEDAVEAAAHNDKKYSELKQYIKTSYALSDEEINDDELRRLTRFTVTDKSNKIPELGNMITYIIRHPELLDNNTRLVQVLEKFKKSNTHFIDLTACNMFVHNQYFSPNVATLETSVNILAPVLDVMYTAIKNEE